MTSAAERDVELTRVMEVTRHRDVRTVTGYARKPARSLLAGFLPE